MTVLSPNVELRPMTANWHTIIMSKSVVYIEMELNKIESEY